jgi:hypothetical protein
MRLKEFTPEGMFENGILAQEASYERPVMLQLSLSAQAVLKYR